MKRRTVDAEYVAGAAGPEQFPAEGPPEFAFLGRSNVGKSSLLNRLLDVKRLAHISSRPGCTQLIHFYRVGDGLRFVDLPGYGFAKVPRPLKESWKALIEAYLIQRKSLETCLLLLDARRGWMEKDLELKQWLEFHERRYLVIATKIDKLKSQSERIHGLAAIRAQCPGNEPLPFSAVTGQGAREIWQAIMKPLNRT